MKRTFFAALAFVLAQGFVAMSASAQGGPQAPAAARHRPRRKRWI